MSNIDSYWATTDIEELAIALEKKRETYYKHCEGTGRLALWRKSHRLYYGVDDEGTTTSFAPSYGGQQGELVLSKVNNYYSLLEHIHVLITGTRPTLKALGLNNSNKAQTAAKLAEGVFEYYLREGRLEKSLQLAAKYALRFGEGWIYACWDGHAGDKPVGAYTEQLSDDPEDIVDVPVYGGDIVAVALAPYDIIRDVNVDIGSKTEEWTMVHQKKNKWNLVSLYPKYKDEILAAPVYDFLQGSEALKPSVSDEAFGETDLVSIFEFYHRPTPALPEGRYAVMVGSTVIADGPLPYNKLPTLPMRPDIENLSAFGYTNSFNLMGLQDIYDSVFSTIVSKHDALGLPSLWKQKAAEMNVKDITSGLSVLESDVKPEVIDLLPDLSQSSKLLELINGLMSTQSGINEVARGNPDSNIKSGAMAALFHSMAIQYNSGLQASYAQMFEGLGTHFLDIARKYIKDARLITITGPRGASWRREFRGSDLEGIDQIVVESSNALLRTTAGRQQIADQLLAANMLKSPEQYLTVLSSGRLEHLFDLPDTRQRGMLAENDMMSMGRSPKVLVTDHHLDHIKAHEALLNEPENRLNEELCETVLLHIQEHIDTWAKLTTERPDMLAIIDLPPLPAPTPIPMGGAPMTDPNAAPKGTVDNNPVATPPAEAVPLDLANVSQGLEGSLESGSGEVRLPNIPKPSGQ